MSNTVRKQKSGDQLAAGDWLAPDEVLDGAAEVLFAYAYPASADGSRDSDGQHVQLVVRGQEKTAAYATVVSGYTLFDLASDEELAALREQAERAKRIADIRALADFLEKNPDCPAPDSVHAQASPGRYGDVWNSGLEGIAEVRRVAGIFGEKVQQDEERTEVVKRFGGFDYTYIAWHKVGRPAEPVPEAASDRTASGCLAQTTEAFTMAPVPCSLPSGHADAHKWAYEGRSGEFADPTGLTYSRDADDSTPVSSARQPLHTGAVTDEGLVDESEHHQVAGSVGGPGENGAECVCGVVFDGFDTIAEANEQLARHVADANA